MPRCARDATGTGCLPWPGHRARLITLAVLLCKHLGLWAGSRQQLPALQQAVTCKLVCSGPPTSPCGLKTSEASQRDDGQPLGASADALAVASGF